MIRRGGGTVGAVLVVVTTGPVEGGVWTSPEPPAPGGGTPAPASPAPASAHPSTCACKQVESETRQLSVVQASPSLQSASVAQQFVLVWCLQRW
jgi:hypothetical protein